MLAASARRRDAADALEEAAAAAAPAAAASAAGPAGAAPAVAHERQLGFHLGVLRKAVGHRQVDGAARRVEAIGAGPQPRRHVVAVADEELGEVDQHAVAAGGGNGKPHSTERANASLHRP